MKNISEKLVKFVNEKLDLIDPESSQYPRLDTYYITPTKRQSKPRKMADGILISAIESACGGSRRNTEKCKEFCMTYVHALQDFMTSINFFEHATPKQAKLMKEIVQDAPTRSSIESIVYLLQRVRWPQEERLNKIKRIGRRSEDSTRTGYRTYSDHNTVNLWAAVNKSFSKDFSAIWKDLNNLKDQRQTKIRLEHFNSNPTQPFRISHPGSNRLILSIDLYPSRCGKTSSRYKADAGKLRDEFCLKMKRLLNLMYGIHSYTVTDLNPTTPGKHPISLDFELELKAEPIYRESEVSMSHEEFHIDEKIETLFNIVKTRQEIMGGAKKMLEEAQNDFTRTCKEYDLAVEKHRKAVAAKAALAQYNELIKEIQ